MQAMERHHGDKTKTANRRVIVLLVALALAFYAGSFFFLAGS